MPSLSKSDWLVLCVGVGLIAVALWLFVPDHKSDQAQGRRPSPSSTTVPSLKLSAQDTAALSRSVKSFSEAYFSLAYPSKSTEQVKQDIHPYVTDDFLKNAHIGPGSSEAFEAMQREKARLVATTVSEVKPLPDMDSPLVSDGVIQGIVTLRVIKYDRDDHVVSDRTRPQKITAFKQGAVWRIDEAPSTY